MDPLEEIKQRLTNLNLKAYYLLIALSFAYRTPPAPLSLKLALTLTALGAVLPLQDWWTSDRWLKSVRWFKVLCLLLALGCTLRWVWWVS